MPRPSGTWATPSRAIASGLRRSIRRPSKVTRPRVRISAETARSAVVLPAPLAPRIVVMLPALEREVDAEQGLGLAVEGLETRDLEQSRHQAAAPR